MFELDLNARLSNVTVKSKEVTAAINISLSSGLVDQLLTFLGKDLKLTYKADGYDMMLRFQTASLHVHADSTASATLAIRRRPADYEHQRPSVIDWLLDLDEDEYYDYVLEVDHAQPSLLVDNTTDEARPSAGALAEAEDDGVRTYTATPEPALY